MSWSNGSYDGVEFTVYGLIPSHPSGQYVIDPRPSKPYHKPSWCKRVPVVGGLSSLTLPYAVTYALDPDPVPLAL